ncbi:unnamed protein product [Acanthoscelides obtectus]|uniref:Uncharacterized protein n=1 Tax=Acanthoscelides obtectus TaxID=200917 RepID=A0A9P0LV11_ACAOB|nr:unnamed protein product [Acanthoscelides obtectus]CAK1677840.1 hypothetical protein AOBTE_LOCUS31582 [Acanthoscelides obtectus]
MQRVSCNISVFIRNLHQNSSHEKVAASSFFQQNVAYVLASNRLIITKYANETTAVEEVEKKIYMKLMM